MHGAGDIPMAILHSIVFRDHIHPPISSSLDGCGVQKKNKSTNDRPHKTQKLIYNN